MKIASPLCRFLSVGLLASGLLTGGAAAQETDPLPSGAHRVLTLSAATDAALKAQPSLRQARANTDAAAGRVEQARSGYLPQVTGTGSYQRTTGNVSARPGTTSVTNMGPPLWSSRTYNYFNFGVTASQLIYDFGQTSGRWRAAAANEEAARASERTTQSQVLFAVRRGFFQARAQRELIKVAQEAVNNQDRHVKQIQAFVRAGMRDEIDLAQVRTDRANSQVQLINAENGYQVAKAQLDQAIGMPGEREYELGDDEMPAVEGEDGALEPFVDTAFKERPELLALQRQREAQERATAALRGAYGPSLSAVAGATETGLGLDRLVPNWVIGANLNWPFFQGGLTHGQVHEASAVLRGLDAQLDAVRLQIRVDVDQALVAIRGAKGTGAAAGEALANAKEQLRLAEGRYQNGLGNAIELGDAQVAFTTASAQVVQAHYNLAIARAQLSSALGR